MKLNENNLNTAIQIIENADCFLIGAGAGMGVDSGLPDYRGNDGFWKAYPKLQELGLSYRQIGECDRFIDTPELAWAFYGHRLDLYRQTVPHQGFEILKAIVHSKKAPSFVFTSNVDGQFQKAGFEPTRIVECHGTVHQHQCSTNCRNTLWEAEASHRVDLRTMSIRGDYPRCPACNGAARPNVLLFVDGHFCGVREREQRNNYEAWKHEVRGRNIASIEVGAGHDIPFVRVECRKYNSVIRINPKNIFGNGSEVYLEGGALEVLECIQSRL